VYPSGFKYPVVRIYPSIGLLPASLSNTQSSTEILVAADCYGTSKRHYRRPHNAFFIDPYVDKRKDRRERTRKHHDNVLKVFQDWRMIQLGRVKTIDGLYGVCIPLYIDVASSLQRYDKYNEGILHLPSYASYDILLNIIRLQDEHNLATSQFMAAREQTIRGAISNNTTIPEWRSPDDQYPWYKLAKIFEHFEREAYQNVELRIEPYSSYQGIEYYKLFREPADLIAVAERTNLEKLKELIDLEAQSTVSGLRDRLEDNDRMQNLLNTFSENMDDILHDVPTRGLQGQCHIEREIHIPVIFRGPVIRFFRRRLLRYRPHEPN
jgi:hypothetical protein